MGPPARDLRPRPAPHAERRGVLPRAARPPRPARLHRQQRLPDRAPPARVLRAHDGERDGGAARHAGAQAPPPGGSTGAHPRRSHGDPPAALLPRPRYRGNARFRRAVTGEAAAGGPSVAEAISSRRACSTRICSRSISGERNSWRMLLADVSSVELLEVQLVNADRAVRPERAPQAADAAHARARQAHRQRVRRRGPVLPELQDDPPSAHEHGEGRAEHDDPHRGGGLPGRRHPHEQRGHRLGDRRGSGRDRGAEGRGARLSIRRSTSWTAPRASSTRSSPGSTRASMCGDSS